LIFRSRAVDLIHVSEPWFLFSCSSQERALREKSGLAPLQTEQQSASTVRLHIDPFHLNRCIWFWYTNFSSQLKCFFANVLLWRCLTTTTMISWAIQMVTSKMRNWVRLWTILLTNLVHPVAGLDLVHWYLLHVFSSWCSILSARLRILIVTFSDHRKEKSLGLLTQNFVKLFLTMEVSNS